MVRCRIFEAWSIEVPATFDQTFVAESSYWHGYDEGRSTSLTSVLLTDARGPVPAAAIVKELPPIDGDPLEALPEGLVGWAVTIAATPPSRASRVISGVLAAYGRILIVTITSDDEEWARRVWMSIRYHPAQPLPRSAA